MPICGITAEQLQDHILQHERREAFYHFEYQIPSNSGDIQYFSICGIPLFDDNGRFLGYQGVGKNITELRLAEAAVRERERQLVQIVSGSPIATFVINVQKQVTHWNEACVQLTGKNSAEMLSSTQVWSAFYLEPHQTLAEMVVSDESDETISFFFPTFVRSKHIKNALEVEKFFPGLGENGLWIYFTAAPLYDSNGNISGAIETLQDTSERRRADELLKKHALQLKKEAELLEQSVKERTGELSQQVHFMRQLIDAIPIPLYFKDMERKYLGCNNEFLLFIGKSLGEVVGKTVYDISPAELAKVYDEADRTLLQDEGIQLYETRVEYTNGQTRDVIFHKATFTDPKGNVAGMVGLMVDITERKRLEIKMRQAASVFATSLEGITISNSDGSIIAVNRAFTQITGYTESEVIGRNPSLLQSGKHDKAFYKKLWQTIAEEGRWAGDIWNRRKSGALFPVWISIAAVKDTDGRLVNYIATFTDLTEHKHNEEKIHLLAFTDALTGLPNRRFFLDRLQHAIDSSERSSNQGALFLVDIDDFKGINDTQGHEIGDLLLEQVGRRLVECIRPGDTVARLGGDEFVVLIVDIAIDINNAIGHAEIVCSKIREALKKPFFLNEYVHHMTASIGVTIFVEKNNALENILKQADLALHRAKAMGRGSLCFFDPEMQTKATERVGLEADLRQGLVLNQFELYYQAQLNDKSQIIGVEALIRWNHPIRGMVSPGEFVPIAEESGLILELGQWVLETACKQLEDWATSPQLSRLTMAVNVSAKQFGQPDFVKTVRTVLSKYFVKPGSLKIELTESLLLNNVEEVIAKMTEIREMGVNFSLDDFGTGYSSLSYLKRLPLQQLKIDQSFVRDVLTDSNDAAIARAIVSMAHSMGLTVIAEGVESKDQLRFLKENGCLAYQGYLFSKPLTKHDFEKFLLLKEPVI
jgi:diguanylate cyclase (GGDEF)-like protein/PAS domain S-box-containing protein